MSLNIQEYCENLLENFLVDLIVDNHDDGLRTHTNADTISINHRHIMVNLSDSRLLDSHKHYELSSVLRILSHFIRSMDASLTFL